MTSGLNFPATQSSPMMESSGNVGEASGSGKVGGYGSSNSGLIFNQTNMILDMSTPNISAADMTMIEDVQTSMIPLEMTQNTSLANNDDDLVYEQNPNKKLKKKKYHRHTQKQTKALETFFKQFPHPDDKQRKELGQELGLDPFQVKFWFQNKRTQLKTQFERHENTQLRAKNEKLSFENKRFKEALSRIFCSNCNGPTPKGEMPLHELHLRLENARLKEEMERIFSLTVNYGGNPMENHRLVSAPVTQQSHELCGGTCGEMHGPTDLLRSLSGHSEEEKRMIIELALTSIDELTTMAQIDEPLWNQGIYGITSFLNEEEYVKTFPRGLVATPLGFKCEASRETCVVVMYHTNLVEIMMNVNQWWSVFSEIVSRAITLEVLSTGVAAGNFDGAIQVMTAELQVPSPLVPTREIYFLRYCKQHAQGTWAVVDVSLENLPSSPLSRCWRRPSGCLIQEMPNGYSKVTWVEHVEVDDNGVHNIYKPIVNSGLAFGAKRWIATLERQCERLAIAMLPNPPNYNENMALSQTGRKNLLRLAERLVISFCGGMGASTAQTWTILSGNGADDVRVMARKNIDDPGRPIGIALSAATSFWLPVPPNMVFDFLTNVNTRTEWDILCNGGGVFEMTNIANGRGSGNCVSLLRVTNSNSETTEVAILQESFTNQTASFIVYAPIDINSMSLILHGGGADCVPILPSGFAILPDGPLGQGGSNGESGCGGSLLTVAFQILGDTVPTAKVSLGSVYTVTNLITSTVDKIKASAAGVAG